MSESVQSMHMCYPYALHLFHFISLGGPLAKVGSSAMFCVVVFKASLLWYLGGPLAKVGSSAMFCVVVFKASLLWYLGGPLAKVGSSAKFCVVVCKSSLLWYWGVYLISECTSSEKFTVTTYIMSSWTLNNVDYFMLSLSLLLHILIVVFGLFYV